MPKSWKGKKAGTFEIVRSGVVRVWGREERGSARAVKMDEGRLFES